MLRTVLAHMRSQWAGFLALFLVIAGGTAYAANTVFSSDIVNGEVKSPDIGNNQVKSIDVRDDGQPEGGLGSVDIANGSLTRDDVADESLWGQDILDGTVHAADITNESLTGTDVVESTLGEVPSARLGGYGRSVQHKGCAPDSTTFVDCGFVSLNLPSQSRVLLIAPVTPFSGTLGGTALGNCRLVSSDGVVSGEVDALSGVGMTLTDIVLFPAGPVDFGVECNETGGDIGYKEIAVSAVAISPA